jgi:hypothetical protein
VVGGGGGFSGDSRRRRREEGGTGATMRLIRVEDYSLNIMSRHNFLLNISIFLYFHKYKFLFMRC